VLVNAPRDAAELDSTVARLLAGDDPPSEIMLMVGIGDTVARAVAEQAAARRRGLVKVVAEDALFDATAGEPVARRAADWLTAHARRSGEALSEAGLRLVQTVSDWRSRRDADDRAPPSSFSVLVPAPRDAAELDSTVARLLTGDDPPSEILLVVGIDDAGARAVAEQAAAHHRGIVKVVDEDALFDAQAGNPAAGRALEWVTAHVPWSLLARLVAFAAAAVVVTVAIQTASFLYLLYVVGSLALAAIACTTLVWMLHAWRTPSSLAESGRPREDLEPAFSFSLIVPARHEQAVLEGTLLRLLRSDHPDFELLVVVGDDDPATREVAERVAAHRPDRVKVIVDAGRPKSKPRALNAALPHCTGAITGVFDAEDDVHPALLQRVDQCFQKTGADVVQAGVQLMNFRSSWLTVRNVLEYYFWFRSRLHFHASQRFIPLGGNTVFVRTQLLQQVSGWDPDCLAEDCELGVRLSALGAQTVVFYEAELVTREECPPTLRAFARQRTRWNQGFLQTLARGHWRRLPLQRRALGVYTLAMPYLMAVVWLTIPLAIATAVAVKAPVPITLISFLPALLMLAMLAVEVVGLGDFCRTYGERASARDYLRLVVGLPLYQSVLAFAAVRAVVREARGERGWEKTEHLGLHLSHAARAESELAVSASPRIRPVARVVEASTGNVALLEREEARPREPTAGNGNGHWNGWTSGDLAASLAGDPPWVSRPHSGSLLRRRLLSAHADLVLLVALLAFVGVIQATNMLHWPDAQFDEGTYVSNAWAVQHGALAPYTYSYGHPPLAWLLIALWTWARGVFAGTSYSIDTGRELMFVVTMVSCGLVFTLARRLGMQRTFAAGAVILFALSPVGLFFHRTVLLDNVAIAWALAAFVLAFTPRRRLWAFAASGACFAASLLSKETTLVLLPALLLAAAYNADKRTRRYCLALLGSFLGLIALSYPLYAILKGELLPGPGHVSLVGYTIVQLVTRKGTGSLFDPHSETHAIVTAWLGLDPWLLGAALVLCPIALARRNTRAIAVAFLIQVLMILRPGYLPNMYVIGLLPFAALIVAGAGEAIWRKARVLPSWPGWSVRAAALTVALTVVAVVAPSWAHSDRVAMTVRLDGTRRAAERWVAQNIGHDRRLIVPDEYWIYLIQHGFDEHPMPGGFFSRTVVVYWPLDYDPAVKKSFPDGWRDFDYIVSTQAVRSTLRLTPTTAEALEHSRVVRQFGKGVQRIEIRAITRGQRLG
jgi:cellulose synthase/poly-beta-1,6-N-acetylglucosamine synthase-like glycosyltransferase